MEAVAVGGNSQHKLPANDNSEKIVPEGESSGHYSGWDMAFLPSGEGAADGLMISWYRGEGEQATFDPHEAEFQKSLDGFRRQALDRVLPQHCRRSRGWT